MIGNRGIEGDVAARMDAYRGNPNALMQRYSQSQELIDLLALQKLKSEKEAAARDMQMKMAQQQAAQGLPPTIREQREQEVMGMTKQELAQQMGGIAQQRQQDQQRKMQQLMQSGVATLPAPGVANMAGGGIVAFADGGSTFDGFEISSGESSAPAPSNIQIPKELVGKIDFADIQDIRAGRYGRTREEILSKFASKLRAPAQRPPSAPAASSPEAAAPQAPQPTPEAPKPADSGVAGLIDPFARQTAEEERITRLRRLTPEQRKALEENMAGIRSLYQEEMSPEARRERQLSAFLRGAGGRTSFGSVMAGGSGAAEAERQRGFQQGVKGTELIQKKMEDIIGAEREAVKGGIEGGIQAARLAADVRGQNLRAQQEGQPTDFMRKWNIYTNSLRPGEKPTAEGFQRAWGQPDNTKEYQKLRLAIDMLNGGYTQDQIQTAVGQLFGESRQGAQRFFEGQESKDRTGKPIVFKNGQWVYK